METIALKDKNVFPEAEILKAVLAGSYPAFVRWEQILAEMGTALEWRYYRDGQAWLGKMICGKKNMGWVIVYEGYFRVTFYFMEKHFQVIADADLPETVKKDFFGTEAEGKLKPMSVMVTDVSQTTDVLAVFRFKKALK